MRKKPVILFDLVTHKPTSQEEQVLRKETKLNINDRNDTSYSVFATKVLYKEASESGTTAHTSTPIFVTPALIED